MKTTLTVDVEFDPDVTDAESIASAADRLLETVLSTPGIMEEYAEPRFGQFFVAPSANHPSQSRPTVVVEIAGGVLQEAHTDSPVRLVLLDWDAEDCQPAAEEGLFKAGGEVVHVAEMPAAPINEIVGTNAEEALEAAGIDVLGEQEGSLQESQRWVLYDCDADVLLRTKMYSDYEEAVEDAAQANDILVLPLVIRSCSAAG
ncbi:MAG: hypothetical protein ABSF26_21080 [Thermoguttaceae bacterium]|jgi:hypothetical protein